tara:strand:- start:2718 stop:3083 length:366 start_codon:yes stop_codon:yes gene_type:complete
VSQEDSSKKKTGEPHHRLAGTQIEDWIGGSHDATTDHDRGRIAWTVPTGLAAAWLGGEAEVIEVLAQELVVELSEEIRGCGRVNGDDLVNDLFACESRWWGLHQWFASCFGIRAVASCDGK